MSESGRALGGLNLKSSFPGDASRTGADVLKWWWLRLLEQPLRLCIRCLLWVLLFEAIAE